MSTTRQAEGTLPAGRYVDADARTQLDPVPSGQSGGDALEVAPAVDTYAPAETAVVTKEVKTLVDGVGVNTNR